MSERDLNEHIRKALAGYDPVRVENAAGAGAGTPDINYLGGWIESKWLPRWPADKAAVVKVTHYRRAQRAWHARRRWAGGRCHVVIDVAGDVFVFDALAASRWLGVSWSRADFFQFSLCTMEPWDGKAFRSFIQQCDKDRGI